MVKKFLFDVNLFDNDSAADDLPPAPVFSESELEAARTSAYEEGKKLAEAEAKASRSQQLTNIMDVLAKNVTASLEQEGLREKKFEREVVNLTLCALEKIFPAYNAHCAFAELTSCITHVLEQHSGNHKINIFVHPDFVEGISKFMDTLAARNADFSFSIAGDDTLAESACKIAWADGGAVRDTKKIAEEILEVLKDTLAEKDANRHDES